MQPSSTFVKVSVSLPSDLWQWVKNQKTTTGISVPASRVIAASVERLKSLDAKKTARK
jgi:hypothetical protein